MSSTELRVKELLRERGWTTKVLAEKTGMSESYLTHIKNGTRRWNEDAMKKLSSAFDLQPIDLFSQHKKRTDDVDNKVKIPEKANIDLKLAIVPVMKDIPSNPSPYNNQLMQSTTGCKDKFLPVFNSGDDSIFCLLIENNSMAPKFVKNDHLIISPEQWTHSGDIAAVEYGNENKIKGVFQVSYVDEFVVLESVNHKQSPVALIRSKDHFRVIGKIIGCYQNI